MKNRRIVFGAAGILGSLLVVTVAPVHAHCYAGQVCIPDPCNSHHGGTCPPTIQASLGATQSMEKLNSSGAVNEIFTVVEIESLNAPVNPSGETKILPAFEMPRSSPTSKASSPGQPAAPVPSDPSPMTPAVFAMQALPIRSDRDLDIVKQGVLSSSRELLDVVGSAASENEVGKTAGRPLSARMSSQRLKFSSEALRQLQQYDRIMTSTLGMIGQGEIPITENKWTEMEKLMRYTQSIIQVQGAPNK